MKKGQIKKNKYNKTISKGEKQNEKSSNCNGK